MVALALGPFSNPKPHKSQPKTLNPKPLAFNSCGEDKGFVSSPKGHDHPFSLEQQSAATLIKSTPLIYHGKMLGFRGSGGLRFRAIQYQSLGGFNIPKHTNFTFPHTPYFCAGTELAISWGPPPADNGIDTVVLKFRLQRVP